MRGFGIEDALVVEKFDKKTYRVDKKQRGKWGIKFLPSDPRIVLTFFF